MTKVRKVLFTTLLVASASTVSAVLPSSAWAASVDAPQGRVLAAQPYDARPFLALPVDTRYVDLRQVLSGPGRVATEQTEPAAVEPDTQSTNTKPTNTKPTKPTNTKPANTKPASTEPATNTKDDAQEARPEAADPGIRPQRSPIAARDVLDTFENQYSGHCLEDGSRGYDAVPCTEEDEQSFKVHLWADGTRQVKNVETGRCMEDGTQGLRSAPCFGPEDPNAIYQSWFVHVWGDDTIQLRNEATGRCLSEDRNGFRTAECLPGTNPLSTQQSWL